MSAASAYDIWSLTYDSQDRNPLLFLDDELLDDFLRVVNLRAKTVVDVGCGTGRHWKSLFAREPEQVVGYDVSPGMLGRLREKYPQANVHQLDGQTLSNTADASCDVVISTLALGYIADIDAAFAEWSRVLRSGGDVLITDMHPDVAAHAERSFRHEARTILIRHHVHPLPALRRCAAAHQLDIVRIDEKVVDDSIRKFYEIANSVDVFEKTKGTVLMYGAHLRKVVKASIG